MKGIFYIHNNTPVIATEMKPEESPFSDSHYHPITLYRNKALKEWERQLIPIKNHYEYWNKKTMHQTFQIAIDEYNYLIGLTPGQAIEYEGNVITKTL